MPNAGKAHLQKSPGGRDDPSPPTHVTDASRRLSSGFVCVVVSETRPAKKARYSPPFSSCESKERTIHTSLAAVVRRAENPQDSSAASAFGGGTVVVAKSVRAEYPPRLYLVSGGIGRAERPQTSNASSASSSFGHSIRGKQQQWARPDLLPPQLVQQTTTMLNQPFPGWINLLSNR